MSGSVQAKQKSVSVYCIEYFWHTFSPEIYEGPDRDFKTDLFVTVAAISTVSGLNFSGLTFYFDYGFKYFITAIIASPMFLTVYCFIIEMSV